MSFGNSSILLLTLDRLPTQFYSCYYISSINLISGYYALQIQCPIFLQDLPPYLLGPLPTVFIFDSLQLFCLNNARLLKDSTDASITSRDTNNYYTHVLNTRAHIVLSSITSTCIFSIIFAVPIPPSAPFQTKDVPLIYGRTMNLLRLFLIFKMRQ